MRLYKIIIAACIIFGSNHSYGQVNSSAIDKEIREMMRVYQVPGLSVAVVSDTSVILCKGFGIANIETKRSFDEHTPARLASATKFLTGLVFLSMANKGVIRLNDTLGKYLQDIPEDWKSIPLWRMMNHTSGIPTPDNTPFAKMTDDEQRKLTERTEFEMIHKLPLDYKPGERWRYQQTAFLTLSMIISSRTGKSWPDMVNETILQPAGMQNTVHNEMMKYSPENYPKNYEFQDGKLVFQDYFYVLSQSTGAGYNTTASDMAKMFVALNQDKIVPLDFLQREVFLKERMFPITPNSTYSLATEIKDFGKFHTIGHSGGPDIANIRYCPEKKVGVVVLANRSTSGIAEDLTNRILRYVLLKIPFDAQKKPVAYEIRKRLGSYSYDDLIKFIDHARKHDSSDFTDMENGLNNLGYELLSGQKQITAAIKVLKLNTHYFPKSANAFDSLGEVLLASGEKAAAIRMYKISIKLDPRSENGKKMLAQLTK